VPSFGGKLSLPFEVDEACMALLLDEESHSKDMRNHTEAIDQHSDGLSLGYFRFSCRMGHAGVTQSLARAQEKDHRHLSGKCTRRSKPLIQVVAGTSTWHCLAPQRCGVILQFPCFGLLCKKIRSQVEQRLFYICYIHLQNDSIVLFTQSLPKRSNIRTGDTCWETAVPASLALQWWLAVQRQSLVWQSFHEDMKQAGQGRRLREKNRNRFCGCQLAITERKDLSVSRLRERRHYHRPCPMAT